MSVRTPDIFKFVLTPRRAYRRRVMPYVKETKMSQSSDGGSDFKNAKAEAPEGAAMDGALSSENMLMSDTTAPSLSSAEATDTGASGFDWQVTTDESNGSVYWVAVEMPSAEQIKAGQDHTGSPAAASGNQAVSTTGSQSGSGSGLTAERSFTWFALHRDEAGNDSDVVSDTFATQAVAGPLAVEPQTFAFGTGTRGGEGAYSFGAVTGTIASVGSLTGTNAADFAAPSVTAGQVSIAPASNGSANKANYDLTLRCYDGPGQTGNFADVSLTITTVPGRTIAATGDEGTDEIARVINLSSVEASGLTVYLRPGFYRTNAAASLPVGNPGRIRFNDKLKGLTDTLTLRAADLNDKPRVERWTVWNQGGVDGDAGRITFDGIHFFRPVAEGPPIGSESDLVGFRGAFAAVDLVFQNCLFTSNVGLAREGYSVGSQITGIRFNNVDRVTVEDCEFANLIDAITMRAAENVVVQRNVAHHCYADFLGVNQSSKSVTVRDNIFCAFTGDGASLHPDWIQGFTASNGAGDVEDLNVFGNITFFTDEGFKMPPVISSNTPHAPVTNVTFADTVGGVYTIPSLANYRNFGFNTFDGPITAILPDANGPGAARVGIRKSSADANTLTIEPPDGNVLASEVDSSSSHNAPQGPEWSFIPSTGTWAGQRRKRPGVIDYADTVNGAYEIEANGVTSVFRFDTSGGPIIATLPASNDPNAATVSVQKFGDNPNSLTILPAGADVLTGNADASNQHVMSGAFEAVTWNPGSDLWSGQELWPTLQGALLQALKDGNVYKRIYFHGNVIYANAIAGIKLEEDTYGFTAYRNTLVRPWPGDQNGDGVANTPADGRPAQLGYPGIGLKNRQHNVAESNICGGFSSVDQAEDLYVTTNNYTDLDNSLASYTSVLAGTTEGDFNPQTAAQVLAPLRPQPGSSIALNGQGALGVTAATDYYDFATRSFTDLTAPTIAASRPSPPIDQFVWLEFDKPVKLALAGTVTLYSATDDSVVETFDLEANYGDAANVNGGAPGTICDGGRRIFLRPTVNLTPAASYYIQFGTGMVKTLQGADFAGISNKTDWAFTAAVPSQNILPWGAQSFGENTVWKTGNLTVISNPAGDYTVQRVPNPEGTITISLDTSRADYPGQTLPTGNTYTFAFKCKQGSGAAVRTFRHRFGAGGTLDLKFNVETGAWTTPQAPGGPELNVSGPDGNGFYRFMVSWQQTGTTRWRIENLFGMGIDPNGEDSVVMKEPMLWRGLYSVTGELPYEVPDLP